MMIHELLHMATARFESAGVPNPRVDAEWLLTHCLNCRRSDLLLNGEQVVSDTAYQHYDAMTVRRCAREPLQYILGTQDFFGRPFRVTRDVLIPRPETEQLVEQAISLLANRTAPLVLDIGTGSGCIAITIALEVPASLVVAVDASVDALRIAKQNAESHAAVERVRLLAADLFPSAEHAGPFDLVISNPPYCADAAWHDLQPEVRDFEPKAALVAEQNGLACLFRIVQDAPDFLQSGGALVLECGLGQAERVAHQCALRGAYTDARILNDLQGVARFVIAQKS